MFDDEDEDGLDALVNSAVENGKTSFKRTDPANYAEATGNKKSNNIPNAKAPNPEANAVPSNNPTTEEKDNDTAANIEDQPKPKKLGYCHYYSNFGRCDFELRNGRKCKFSHEKAPLCRFDRNCDRRKCMFSHSKPSNNQRGNEQQNNTFLDQSWNTQYPMNPWDMMSMFMQATQNQPNSWQPMGYGGKFRGGN